MQAKELGPCEVYVKTKCTRYLYPTSKKDRLELSSGCTLHDAHSIFNASVTGDAGFVYFLDDHTDFAVTTLIERKSDVAL